MRSAWVDCCKTYRPQFTNATADWPSWQIKHRMTIILISWWWWWWFALKWLIAFDRILCESLYLAEILTIFPLKKCNVIVGEDGRNMEKHNVSCLFWPTLRCSAHTQASATWKPCKNRRVLTNWAFLNRRCGTVYTWLMWKHVGLCKIRAQPFTIILFNYIYYIYTLIFVTHHMPPLQFGLSHEHLLRKNLENRVRRIVASICSGTKLPTW